MALKSSMSFKVGGISIAFSSNAHNYRNFSRATQKRVRDRMAALMDGWANEVVAKAIAYCPHYSGNLEQAIVKSDPYLYRGAGPRGQMAVQVGVLDTWESPYDDRNPPWGVSSPELLVRLHEFWDDLAGKEARERAAKKGPGVGAKFLTRAAEEASESFARNLKRFTLFSPVGQVPGNSKSYQASVDAGDADDAEGGR